MQPAVFLDRDGVLNRSIVRNGCLGSPRRLDEFELWPGVADAVRRLKRFGLLAIVITNQPDIARGLMEWAALERMHEQLCEMTLVDAIYVCPTTTTINASAESRAPDSCCAPPRSGVFR